MSQNPHITIDRRPLALVLISRFAGIWFLLLVAVLFYLFLSATPWEGMTPESYRAIGVFFLCAILWLTQAIPLVVTGLLAIVLVPILDILPSKEVFSYFGNEAVFFILGAFILAAAVQKTGLATRLSLLFLKSKKLSPKKLTFRILAATAFFSCLMSEHAVAAFFFPVILEIAKALDFEPFGGEYGKTLFLAMAWGCVIGGIVTYLGGARAPLAMGILNEMSGQSVGFFTWMKTTIFVALPMFVAAYFLLTKYFRVDVSDIGSVRTILEKKTKDLGTLSFQEILVGLILLGAIFFWVTRGEAGSMASIAIIAVVILFIFRLVDWKDVEEYVNWGVILMYGGAITLGRAVDSSGALEWLSHKVIGVPDVLSQSMGLSPAFWLIAVLSLLCIFLTELFSNSAVVALLLPISIKMAVMFGLDPVTMTYSVAIPCGLGFIMPMGTPAVTIAYSSGYLKVRDIALPGLLLNLIGWVAFVLVVYFWWPVIGIHT